MTVETIEEFQERRVIYEIMQLKEDGTKPVVWKVMRAAGLKKGCEKMVEAIIRTQCQENVTHELIHLLN